MTLFASRGIAADAPSKSDNAAAKPKPDAHESAVAITFLPPSLENATYSLGIYEAKSGKLVRALQQSAAESAFTVGLNGLITKWDRKDDAGKIVPPGKYAARGYAVSSLKVEGVAFHGNDWISENEKLRIQHVETIAIAPDNDDLVMVGTLAGGGAALLRMSGKDGSLVWKQNVPLEAALENTLPMPPYSLRSVERGVELRQQWWKISVYRLNDGAKLESWADDSMPLVAPGTHPSEKGSELFGLASEGKSDAMWLVGEKGLYQIPKPDDPTGLLVEMATSPEEEKKVQAQATRWLATKPDEPHPRGVAASKTHDRLYLLEEKPGWQRVRGLSWVETKEEDGKKVSTWETFFERNIRTPDPALGLEDSAAAKAPSPVIEITLAENELSPGKPAKAKLTAAFDDKGSYLAAADGLRLRTIGERANLRAVKLAKGKAPGSLSFFQTDGAAWDEFSIAGADKIMSFDAGEFELTTTGEKPAESKAPEPDL